MDYPCKNCGPYADCDSCVHIPCDPEDCLDCPYFEECEDA